MQLVIVLHAPGRLYYYEVQRRYSSAHVYVCSLEYKVGSIIGTCSYLFIALVPQTLPSKHSMVPSDHVQSWKKTNAMRLRAIVNVKLFVSFKDGNIANLTVHY